jgi:hypothetical protein
MLGGSVLNPDSAILSVCGGAIRSNGQIEAALLVDLSELLIRFLMGFRKSSSAVRSTNWVYLMIFISSSIRFATHAGPYIQVISGGKRPVADLRRARLQIGFYKDYRVRSGRGTKKRRHPFSSSIAGLLQRPGIARKQQSTAAADTL